MMKFKATRTLRKDSRKLKTPRREIREKEKMMLDNSLKMKLMLMTMKRMTYLMMLKLMKLRGIVYGSSMIKADKL